VLCGCEGAELGKCDKNLTKNTENLDLSAFNFPALTALDARRHRYAHSIEAYYGLNVKQTAMQAGCVFGSHYPPEKWIECFEPAIRP